MRPTRTPIVSMHLSSAVGCAGEKYGTSCVAFRAVLGLREQIDLEHGLFARGDQHAALAVDAQVAVLELDPVLAFAEILRLERSDTDRAAVDLNLGPRSDRQAQGAAAAAN